MGYPKSLKRRHFYSAAGMAAVYLAVFTAGALAGSKAQTGDLDQYLPSKTLLYWGVPNIKRAEARCQDLPAFKLLAEKEVQEFIEGPSQYAEEKGFPALWKLASRETGVDFSFLKNLEVASIEVALTMPAPPSPDERGSTNFSPSFLFALGCGEEVAAKASELIAEAVKNHAGRNRGVMSLKTSEVHGQTLHSVEFKGRGGEMPVGSWFVRDGRIYGGIGMGDFLGDMLRRMNGEKVGRALTEDADYQAVMKRIGGGDSEIKFFLRIGEPLEQGLAMGRMMAGGMEEFSILDGIITVSGITSLRALGVSAIPSGDHSQWNVYCYAPEPRRGFMARAEGTPVDRSLLKIIPSDAASFSIFSMDMPVVWDTIWEGIAEVNEKANEEAVRCLKEFEEEVGINIREDLIASLGNNGAVYSMPIRSFYTMTPDLNFLLGIKDRARVEQSMTALLGYAQREAPFLKVKEKEYETGKIYSIAFDFGRQFMGPLSAIRPSFGFTDEYMVLSMSGAGVKKTLGRLANPGETSAEDIEGFKRFADNIPEGADSISYSDPSSVIGALYQTCQMFGPMMAMQAPVELPLDFTLLPSTNTITKHFFGEVGYSKTDDEGFFYQAYSPIGVDSFIVLGRGLSTLAAIGAGVHADVLMSERHAKKMKWQKGDGGPGPKSPAHPKAPARPNPAAKAKQDLTDLRSGLSIYKLEYKKYPSLLNQLLAPTEDYPTGFLFGPHKEIPLDPWDNEYIYKLTEGGKFYLLYSTGPNGKDEDGKGDDIVAN